jgi:Zn-dependent peptidase ImmA (M78 family)
MQRQKADYAAIASRLREAGRVVSLRNFCVLQFVENLAEKFPGLKIVPVPDDRLPHARAEANAATNTILGQESLIEAAAHGRHDARFVIVEEVCHIALGHKGPRFRRSDHNQRIYSDSEKRDEREARYLAALVLAPPELARECRCAHEIAQQFGISEQAAEIRWQEVQAEERGRLGLKRELPEGVIDFLRERRERGERVTALDP